MNKRLIDEKTYHSLLDNPYIKGPIKDMIISKYIPTDRATINAKRLEENKEINPLWYEFKEILDRDFANIEFTEKSDILR